MKIWNKLSIKPAVHSGEWYLETGQGMGQSLNIAISLGGYTSSLIDHLDGATIINLIIQFCIRIHRSLKTAME